MHHIIVRKNAHATLANCGEMGYWVIARIGGKLTKLFAGGTLDKGLRVFNWYTKEN